MAKGPTSVRAARIYEYGAPDVLKVEEAPRPEIGPHDVLVRMHATSVNPVDCKMRAGSHRLLIPRKLPTILGMDVSGVIEEVGAKVKGWSVGDEVVSSPRHTREGTYAEYVAVDAGELTKKPAVLTHEEAASLPLVALTAWACLVDHANIQEGDEVFIQAGSGGVGTVAIQLAKHLGARVITSCSERNIELVMDLGADEVINYREESLADRLPEGLSAALDALGDETEVLISKVRNKGAVSMISPGLPQRVKENGALCGTSATFGAVGATVVRSWLSGARAWPVTRRPDGEVLGRIMNLVESGYIKPVMDSTYTLDDIVEAHLRSESGRARGKIAVSIRS